MYFLPLLADRKPPRGGSLLAGAARFGSLRGTKPSMKKVSYSLRKVLFLFNFFVQLPGLFASDIFVEIAQACDDFV